MRIDRAARRWAPSRLTDRGPHRDRLTPSSVGLSLPKRPGEVREWIARVPPSASRVAARREANVATLKPTSKPLPLPLPRSRTRAVSKRGVRSTRAHHSCRRDEGSTRAAHLARWRGALRFHPKSLLAFLEPLARHEPLGPTRLLRDTRSFRDTPLFRGACGVSEAPPAHSKRGWSRRVIPSRRTAFRPTFERDRGASALPGEVPRGGLESTLSRRFLLRPSGLPERRRLPSYSRFSAIDDRPEALPVNRCIPGEARDRSLSRGCLWSASLSRFALRGETAFEGVSFEGHFAQGRLHDLARRGTKPRSLARVASNVDDPNLWRFRPRSSVAPAMLA